MNLPESIKNQTRVLILSDNPYYASLVVENFNRQSRALDYQLLNGESEQNTGCDFFLYANSDPNTLLSYKPTIVLIGTDASAQLTTQQIESITPGGIIIYHSSDSNVEQLLSESKTYLRKIPFDDPTISQGLLETPDGALPISEINESQKISISAAKELLQHMGIMDEEFYESLLDFSW